MIVQKIANYILRLEWVWLAGMIFAYWHRDDPFRYQWDFLLGFAIPIYASRWIVHRRLWTHSPFDVFFISFILLSIYNFSAAPLSRADYFVIICRPLSGIFLVWYFMDHVRQHGHMRYLLVTSIILFIIIGTIGLFATQWESGKGDAFVFITAYLPKIDIHQVMPDMQLSFNPNELAGALAYLCPFLLGLALSQFQQADVADSIMDRVVHRCLRWGALIGFAITFSALMLGQSRFAIAGVFFALLLVIMVIVPRWRYRLPLIGLWALTVLLELLIVTKVLPLQSPSDTGTTSTQDSSVLTERDERTLSSRFEIWESALSIIGDYPLTGSGMSTFRAMAMRDPYKIPYYAGKTYGPPHAHNEFLQMGTDLGLGGFVLYIGWYAVVLYMVIVIFRYKNNLHYSMTIAITSGILAHMGYAIGDAITLWDRFAFLHWWFFALVGASYILVTYDSQISSQQ